MPGPRPSLRRSRLRRRPRRIRPLCGVQMETVCYGVGRGLEPGTWYEISFSCGVRMRVYRQCCTATTTATTARTYSYYLPWSMQSPKHQRMSTATTCGPTGLPPEVLERCSQAKAATRRSPRPIPYPQECNKNRPRLSSENCQNGSPGQRVGSTKIVGDLRDDPHQHLYSPPEWSMATLAERLGRASGSVI